jgi:hypothetical protein
LRLPTAALLALSILSTALLPLHRAHAAAPAAGGKGAKPIARQALPDPCVQALTPKGKAVGLDRRCETEGTGGGAARGDFNGDGYADLAVGVPYEDQNGVGGVGGVNILYGSSAGLTSASDQFLDETNFGVGYNTSDHFGWALASGDYNGDHYSDLAIGMPDYGDSNEGRVFVVHGSVNGLDLSTAKTVDSPFFSSGGRRGAALVWADFNGDGFADLAIGEPEATVTGEGLFCGVFPSDVPRAGRVEVLYGSADGLIRFGAQVFHQGTCGVESDGSITVGDSIEEGDRFGSSLAALGSNQSRASSLVVGVPYEDLGAFDKQDAGMVHTIRGSEGRGLFSERFTYTEFMLTQDISGVEGAAETGDQFGRSLATGDFNNDGKDDLAVGIPFEDLSSNTAADAGAVQVFYSGFATGSLFISQGNLPNVGIEAGDRFGWALAVGDFDKDLRDDLAVGSPGEDVSSIKDAGMASVIYGSSSGLSLTRVQNWTQDSSGVPDTAEPGDQFGYALSAWNYGNGNEADLAVGVPYEDVISAANQNLQVDAGAVNLIYGSPTGLSATARPAQLWTQDSTGVRDTAQPGDRFGNALY